MDNDNISRRVMLLVVFATLALSNASAYDFVVDSIYYNVLSKENKTVAVTYKDLNWDEKERCFHSPYKGDLVIPSKVTYGGKKYTVTEIGFKAFWCGKVSSVIIPNTVKTIRFLAFYMTNIVSIHIPKSVSVIESGVFSGLRCLQTITVDSDNPYFTVSDGVLFDKEMTTLICCPPANERKLYEVPSTVRKICNRAFEDCTIYKIITPSNVNEFEGNPYLSFRYLESINKTSGNAKRQKGTLWFGGPGWPGVSRRERL